MTTCGDGNSATLECSPKRERKYSTSPESFAGFSPKEITKKGSLQIGTPPLRISQPRTSKSKASLVWKKCGTFIEKTIKVEPVEENETASNKSESEIGVDQTDLLGRGKRMRKQKTIDSNGELVVINIDSSMKVKTNSITKLKKQIVEGDQHFNNTNNETLEKVATKKVKTNPIIKLKKQIIERDQHLNNTDNEALEEVDSEQLDKPATSANMKGKLTHALLNKDKIRRQRRMKNRANTNGFKCDQCGRKYKYLRGMRQHKKLECNKDPQFPCPYCPSRFRYRHNIREHVRSYHEQAFPKWYATHYVVPVLL